MLALTSQTIRKVGRYGEDDEDRYMGAALKYLATYDGREYLIKPDVGWPSNSRAERVAAAFYRAIGIRTANCVRASVDGTDAIAVRLIEDAEPVGDNMSLLSRDEMLDVTRGVLGAALIGDGDKHAYNFITDGVHAYSIDHGLAFSGYSGKVNYTGGEHLTAFLESGRLTLADMHSVIDSLPESTGTLAKLAHEHAGVPSKVDTTGWRDMLHAELDRIGDDPYGMADDEPDDECDCEDCMPADPDCDDSDAWGMGGHERYSTGLGRWRTCSTRRHARSAQARLDQSRERIRHGQRVANRAHIEICSPCRIAELAVVEPCQCIHCERPSGRMAGKRCVTYRVFPRKVSDIVRN